MPLLSRSTSLNQYSILLMVVLSSSDNINPSKIMSWALNPRLTDEIFVGHEARFFGDELSWNLFENFVNHFSWERVPGVFWKIILWNMEIVVLVQFPELAVQNIKMLIWEKIPDCVNVLLLVDLIQGLHQIGKFEISKSNLSIVVSIKGIENSLNHSVHFWYIKFWKFKNLP